MLYEVITHPQFIYTVTMQGHGPFNGPRYGKHELDGACPGLPDGERQILVITSYSIHYTKLYEVSPRYPDLDALPPGARIGTSSLRRQCQLRARRPSYNFV